MSISDATRKGTPSEPMRCRLFGHRRLWAPAEVLRSLMSGAYEIRAACWVCKRCGATGSVQRDQGRL